VAEKNKVADTCHHIPGPKWYSADILVIKLVVGDNIILFGVNSSGGATSDNVGAASGTARTYTASRGAAAHTQC